MFEAVLITQPCVNFGSFLSACNEALGYPINAEVDRSATKMSDSEKFLTCLASIRDHNDPFSKSLLYHVSFSAILVCDEDDLLLAMSQCAGMSFVTSDTVAKRISLGVVTGNLAQWRDAVISGCELSRVRPLFNKLMDQFLAQGLNVWGDFNRKYDNGTFLLEHKKR